MRRRQPTARGRASALAATAVVALCLGFPAAPLTAQDSVPAPPPERSDEAPRAEPTATFVGQVVSSATGRPLDGAVVTLLGSGYGAITDSTGSFRIPRAAPGRDSVEVRFIGYEPSRTEVELAAEGTTRAVLLLSPTVVRVAELEVEVRREGMAAKLRGFEERRERGFGVFIGPGDIRDRNPRIPSDLLRGVAGVSVGPAHLGRAPITMGRSARRCAPEIFLDGIHMPGMMMDDLPPEDLGAIEVYRSQNETPVEYQRLRSDCGAILIWTPVGTYEPEASR